MKKYFKKWLQRKEELGNKQGKFYYSFEIKDKKQHAILSQIKLFDAKQLEAKLSTIAKTGFINLEKAFHELMNAF